MLILGIIIALSAIGLFASCVEDLGSGSVSGFVDYGGQACPPFDVIIKNAKTGEELGKTYVANSGAFTFDIPIPSGSHTLYIIYNGNTLYETPIEVTKDGQKTLQISYKDMKLN